MISLLPLLVLGCTEYTVRHSPDPPVADPPGTEADQWGEPPDWTTCLQSFDGRYFNLPGNHPDLIDFADTGLPSAAPEDPDSVDWWDATYAAFDRQDRTLDRGGDWWPVDQGLQGDPAGWSARWLAWIRVTDGGSHRLVLGAGSDAWVLVDDQVVASTTDNLQFSAQTISVDLASGQRRLEVRMAQRGGESGLAFRAVSDDLQICTGR